MTSHALHSSERQDWRTDTWLLDRVRRVGPIVCDPATAGDNPVGAETFYASTPRLYAPGRWLGPCGLAGAWPAEGLTWINSPYGAHLDGDEPDPDAEIWRKVDGVRTLVGIGTGWAARIAMHEGERVNICPNRTEVAWFDRLHEASTVRAEFRKRIPFVDAATGLVGPSPNHGSVLFYHPGPRGLEGVKAFVTAFVDIARILPGGRRI